MDDYPRFTINRGMIILMPKQPFLDWVMRVDPTPSNLTLEDIRREQDGFLVSQESIEITEDAQSWVYRRWKMFFELQLNDWYTEESMWPQKRSLKMFKEWFDIRYHPMLWDMTQEAIQHEDWG